ncbi:homeobox-leucine zipper protein ROC7-like [Nymphaea colorata]|uniref:homeobox-leucine zipper protein ROC7-like n=1 Tax=Nymphaea colorata TaxID=210225 RepID=UPI00214E3CB9|nr:homeobox-leucine zipper protein ROC7-like [Nymphaea colorata]
MGKEKGRKGSMLKLAKAAQKDLLAMARERSFWAPACHGWMQVLSREALTMAGSNACPLGLAPARPGMRVEASLAHLTVHMSPYALVEILMNTSLWEKAFSTMVVKAQESTLQQGAADDNYDGALKWITAEFLTPAPMAPRRHFSFVRFCMKLITAKSEHHTWVVVDVSKRSSSLLHLSHRRRPSGWIIAVDHNGYTVVTLVENVEVEDINGGATEGGSSAYQSTVESCVAFGARRWASALERYDGRRHSFFLAELPCGVVQDFEMLGRMSKLGEDMVTALYRNLNNSPTQGTRSAADHHRGSEHMVLVVHGPKDKPVSTAVVTLPYRPIDVFRFIITKYMKIRTGGEVEVLAHFPICVEGRSCLSQGPTNLFHFMDLLRTTKEGSIETIVQEAFFNSFESFVVYNRVAENFGSMGDAPVSPFGFIIFPCDMNMNRSILTFSTPIVRPVDSSPEKQLNEELARIVSGIKTGL